ncbi:Zn-ribbon domain-containing OB-fold protein [Chloroflexota bacterium]
MQNQVPIDESVLRLPSTPSGQADLLSNKCCNCGEYIFPKKMACPKCFSRDVEEAVLSREGEVYSSTIISLAPPLYVGPLPYAIGVVKSPEGVLIPTTFTECDLDEPLTVGTKVEMVTVKHKEDGEGNEVMIYKFRPKKV